MIPAHVLAAFGVDAAAEDLRNLPTAGIAWNNGTIVGGAVYSRATPSSHWSATLRAKLEVEGVRLAKPLRALDGRFIVGGWTSSAYIDGRPEMRVDETVAAALRLADALVDEDASAGADRDDLFAEAEREAWSLCDSELGELEEASPAQVGHADMLATTIYDGEAAPAVTQLVPFAAPRPRETTAAMVMADAMIFGAESGVDLSALRRFSYLPDIEGLVLRCVYFRKLVAERSGQANSLTRSNIERVWGELISRGSAII